MKTFQVTCKNKKGFILGYANFNGNELDKMFTWIRYLADKLDFDVVTINSYGEKQ